MVREKVKAGALWYIYNMQELIDELKKGIYGEAMPYKEKTSAFKKGMFGGFEAGRRPTPATLATK